MKKAIFIDFYGTVVHEDGEIVKKVSGDIFNKGTASNESEIGIYWWNEFQNAFQNAYGDRFRTQRELECQSLSKTIKHFHSTVDADQLSNMMFEHWMQPPIFEESKEFFECSPLPIYIVSNIDRNDILEAIKFHDLKPDGVFTSEDAKAYKPGKELFKYAMKETDFLPEQIVHIGDSLSSDVNGAGNVGIQAIWINRGHKDVPEGVCAVNNLLEVFDLRLLR